MGGLQKQTEKAKQYTPEYLRAAGKVDKDTAGNKVSEHEKKLEL